MYPHLGVVVHGNCEGVIHKFNPVLLAEPHEFGAFMGAMAI